MSKVLVTESNLEDIADAIRSKNGSENTYKPSEMAAAISNLSTADDVTLVSKSINANGTYNPANDNADGYSSVTVNVQSSGTTLISKNINANGTYNAFNDNADGYSSVSVNVQPTLVTKTISENGTYAASSDDADGYSSVTVEISGNAALSTDVYVSYPIPRMTSDTTPSGTASASSSINYMFLPYMAFNQTEVNSAMNNGWLAASNDRAPWIKYDWGTETKLDILEIHTGNNGTTHTLTLYVEGLTSEEEWENILKTGDTVDVTFTYGTYGNNVGITTIELNGGNYTAFRIRGTESFYKGSGGTACTFSSIIIYSEIGEFPGIGYYGIKAPSSNLGSNGNVYIDTQSKTTYRKINGAWSQI